MAKVFPTNEEITFVRKHLGLSQEEFWGNLGVSQPTGSRYEIGRPISIPVQRLFYLYYLDKAGLSSIQMAAIDAIK